MRPMSLFESGYSSGEISLNYIFYDRVENKYIKEVDLLNIIKYIIVGGWPATIDCDVKTGGKISQEYVKSIINEDIFKVDDIKRDKHKIELLLRSLARNESTTVTNKTLKNNIKDIDLDDINIDTITNYLNLFNQLYITENIPPYSNKIRSSIRIKQSEKRHFTDPSIPSAILSLTVEKAINDLELVGFLFESLVLRDLLIYSEVNDFKLYHYQDNNNNEIDAFIELNDGNWYAFEIKLGAHQIDEAALNLIKIKNEILKVGGILPKTMCVICELSNSAYKRADGVYVVPITALKN